MSELMLLIHMVSGTLALLAGAFFIFNKELLIEKIYVSASLLASIAGFFLIPNMTDGFVAQLGFFTLFLIWLFSILMLIVDSKGTKKWFIRSFALALTFISVRIWEPFFYYILGAPTYSTYPAAIWFSWIINLLIAEWMFLE